MNEIYNVINLSTKLLSHIYSKSHWCNKGAVRVNLKYKEWTKQDLIQHYVKMERQNKVSEKEAINKLLSESFSCYHPLTDGSQCNRCKADTRKFLAILGATGINTDYYYGEHNKPSEFFTKDVREEMIADLKKEGRSFRGQESIETIKALEKL